MEDFKELLEREIVEEFEELEDVELGSEEYDKTVKGLGSLMDRAIELEKTRQDHEEKVKSREDENRFREMQLKEDRKDRLIKNCMTAAGIIIPVGVTIWGTLASFKFEETGTVTTIMGRGFINKLLPKK
jgi:hypothetical protein